MRKLYLLSVLLLLFATGCSLSGSGVYREQAGGFRYAVPDGWRVVRLQGQKYAGIIEVAEDAGYRNIQINDQSGVEDPEWLAAKLVADFRRVLPDFRLLSQQRITTPAGYTAIELRHTHSLPGSPLRQINYLLKPHQRGFFVTCTTIARDGEQFDTLCREFLDSFVLE